MHWSYDPTHYMLMFPRGEKGWAPQTIQLQPGGSAQRSADVDREEHGDGSGAEPRNSSGRYVTSRQFYAYRLQVRPSGDSEYSWLHLFGRLLHQYIVDQYAKIESLRLMYLRNNQNEIRADLYRGIVDAAAGDADGTASHIGTRIVLPPTFVGGPRYMQQQYQNSMAIVRKYGEVYGHCCIIIIAFILNHHQQLTFHFATL